MRNALYSLFVIFSLVLSFSAVSQSSPIEYSRVKIDLTSHSITQIAALGLEADHGVWAKGRHLINDFSSQEIAALDAADIPYEIQIADVKAYYIERSRASEEHGHDHSHTQRAVMDCETGGSSDLLYDYDTPVNYSGGSMGGYVTYSEMLTQLDQMAALYPELISARQPIGSTLTHEGRPIEWLRISDNPTTDEADEPEVLYTALHHAREANSLAQTLFYMWYLLENYATDAEIQYLVDNTEMFFIPCVNPDGYVYNEVTNPNGGGLWRKNRFDNGDGTVGIDLNRNYGYEWGFDNQGSSPNTSSETYRGTAPFSEAETQAVRDFCNARDIQITLNYHTFGNLLIYPWGYSDQPTPDSDTFVGFTEVMTRENNFTSGTGTETVGYTVNGDSDDWMYGEETSKPKIFSMTPEVGPGSFGFWPPASAIEELNKSTMLQNLTAAHLLLTYGEAQEVAGQPQITSSTGTMEIAMKNYGLQTGDLTVSLTAVQPLVALTAQGATTYSMSHLGEETVLYDFVVSDDVLSGEELQFLLTVDNGSYIWSDTIVKEYFTGNTSVLYTDNAATFTAWDATGNWALTTDDFVSGPSSITDSPDGDYQANSNTRIRLDEPIDLTGVTQATLSYFAKWDIEEDWDYVQVMASPSGINYQPLCGIYTELGIAQQGQADGEPLYDGVQSDWVLEQIDLAEYVGDELYIRFQLVSDQAVQQDGFYFDDVQVTTLSDVSSLDEAQASVLLAPYPNPFSDELQVSYTLSESVVDLELIMTNAVGQVVLSRTLDSGATGAQSLSLDTERLVEGVYLLEVRAAGQRQSAQRVVKY